MQLACPHPRLPWPALQGGIHPEFTGDTYLQLLAAAKAAAPDIHVHAFRWGAWGLGMHWLNLASIIERGSLPCGPFLFQPSTLNIPVCAARWR